MIQVLKNVHVDLIEYNMHALVPKFPLCNFHVTILSLVERYNQINCNEEGTRDFELIEATNVPLIQYYRKSNNTYMLYKKIVFCFELIQI